MAASSSSSSCACCRGSDYDEVAVLAADEEALDQVRRVNPELVDVVRGAQEAKRAARSAASVASAAETDRTAPPTFPSRYCLSIVEHVRLPQWSDESYGPTTAMVQTPIAIVCPTDSAPTWETEADRTMSACEWHEAQLAEATIRAVFEHRWHSLDLPHLRRELTTTADAATADAVSTQSMAVFDIPKTLRASSPAAALRESLASKDALIEIALTPFVEDAIGEDVSLVDPIALKLAPSTSHHVYLVLDSSRLRIVCRSVS